MSGPAKTSPGGQVLVSKAGFCLYFFRNYTFPFFISKFNMFFENHFLYNLIFAQACRPQNLNTYAIFDVQSDFEMENVQFLRLDHFFSGSVLGAQGPTLVVP